MRQSAPATTKPINFNASKTTVSDVEVIIGASAYPVSTILGAHVIPVWQPIDWRKAIKDVLYPALGYGSTAALLMVIHWPTAVSVFTGMTIMRVATGSIKLVNRKLEIKAPEYRLVLHTYTEVKEVITAQNKGYLDQIAEEINERAANTQMSAYEQPGEPTRRI